MKKLSALLGLGLLVISFLYANLYIDHLNQTTAIEEAKHQYELEIAQLKSNYEKKISNLQEFITFGQMSLQNTNKNINTADTQSNLSSEFANIAQENINRTIAQKYKILFESLNLSPADQAKLEDLLQQREKILGASAVGYYSTQEEIENIIRQQQISINDIDNQIAKLLPQQEFKEYDLLKDSAYEQHQMNQFYDQFDSSHPVPEENRKNLLLSKLEQQKNFNIYLQDSGKSIASAPAAEKAILAEQVRETLHDYKDRYLQSARENLTPEQFDLFREQEQQQTEEMWNSLKAGWGIEWNNPLQLWRGLTDFLRADLNYIIVL